MANKNCIKILIFLIFLFGFVQSSLRCYDCEPVDGDSCKTPDQSGVKSSVCEGEEVQRSGLRQQLRKIETGIIEPRSQNLTFECVSIYFVSFENENDTGIHRACYERSSDVVSTCDLLKEEINKGNVTYCKSCAENNCNKDEVTGGAVAAASTSLTMLMISAILCFLFLKFD